MTTVNNGWSGIENLSLIPGTVGAAPIQNIGAYGTELKDTFHCLYAIDNNNGDRIRFNFEECEFDYRSSVFKTSLKNKYFMLQLAVNFNCIYHNLIKIKFIRN